MKRWLLLASFLLACCQVALADDSTKEVGAVVGIVQKGFDAKCKAARAAVAGLQGDEAKVKGLDVQLNCDCGPQALTAAFPASMHATQVTAGAFQARMGGAAEICMARALRVQLTAQCAQGSDPFSRPGEAPSPARATARCACLQTSVAKVADGNFTKAADASSARYAAQVAATGPGQPAPQPAMPGAFIQESMQRCSAVTAPTK